MAENEDTLNFTLDDLFKDPEEQTSQEPAETKAEQPVSDKPVQEASEMTKSMSKRINEVRATTERETRDAMAKEFGYDNYEAFTKAKEKQMLKDAGLDEEDIAPIVEKLVEQRLANDPRMKRLDDFEASEKTRFVKDQLKEINKLTGQSYKDVSELPQDVLTMWEKTGNLKQAYLAVQGEELIGRSLAGKQNGTLSHLANPGSTGTGSRVRPLTAEEKAIYRMVDPDLTEEELSKKTLPID